MTKPREVIFDLWPVLHDLVHDLLQKEDDTESDVTTPYSIYVERHDNTLDSAEWVVHVGADDDCFDYRIRAVRG